MELVIFVIFVVVAAGLGLWLGMLAAPHIGRLAERHDEEPESSALQDEAEPGAAEETGGPHDDR